MTHSEAWVVVLEVVYHFVVVANKGEGGLEFWILQCREIPYIGLGFQIKNVIY